ncbi:glycosyltransferase [Lactobacillus sp. CBA3606]|uniref:glycosyltransferase family 2 protein n=1 Tax=Lactobacillus sp. CBA3606 TaxID=2099789 RepID=UPI001319F443|nr:glycosyltransferase [Lactobacillus sp. CBA3606]
MEKLTLIIPTYNSEKYLPELTDRLKKLKSIQIIFVDDGSSLEARKDLSHIARNLKAKVIFNQHRGVSYARNFGLKICKTPYVAFLDSDDLFEVAVFQAIIDRLDTIDSYDIISFALGQKNSEYSTANDKKNLVKQILKIIPSRECIPAPFSKIYRLKMLQDHKIEFPIGVKVGEDMLFNAEAFLVAKRIYVSEVSYYLYRQNLASVTHKVEYNIVDNNKKFLTRLKIILTKYCSKEDAADWYQEMVLITWLSDSFQAVIQSKDNNELIELRKFLRQNISIKKMLFNTLPKRRKFLAWLFLFELYPMIRLLIGKRKKFDETLAKNSTLVKV